VEPATRSEPRRTLFGRPRAVQANRYVRPLTSRARSFAVFLGLTNALLRPAIENDRARLPRFVILKTAAPARGRLGAAAQARSDIATRRETGVATPPASAVEGSASTQSALAAARAVGSRSLTFLLIGRVRPISLLGLPQLGDLRDGQPAHTRNLER
jgi:hypothetical protein